MRYSIFADLLDGTVGQACENPTVLQTNTPVMGNSNAGASFTLGSTCTSLDNPAGEDVYLFQLTEPQYVEVAVTPIQGADLSFAIRTFCENSSADLACEDRQPGGAIEKFGGLLSPGDYYVVVQGPSGGSGGVYNVEFLARDIICSADDNTCLDPNTARYCNDKQTAFVDEVCTIGCDAATGLCLRQPGDVCYAAIDANGGYSGVVEYGILANEFDPGANGCVPTIDANGEDAVFRLDLPPNGVVFASLDPDFIAYPSLYLLTDCGDLSTCQVGSNRTFTSTDEILYVNNGVSDETVFIVADSQDRSSTGFADIVIVTGVQICTPGETQCNGAFVETCNDLGTGYDATLCSFGCAGGFCNAVPNDECGGAIDILASTNTSRTTTPDSTAAPTARSIAATQSTNSPRRPADRLRPLPPTRRSTLGCGSHKIAPPPQRVS